MVGCTVFLLRVHKNSPLLWMIFMLMQSHHLTVTMIGWSDDNLSPALSLNLEISPALAHSVNTLLYICGPIQIECRNGNTQTFLFFYEYNVLFRTIQLRLYPPRKPREVKST